jgi:beta-lactam-binding protein with PASTA domain
MMKFDFLHTQVMKDSVIQESTQTMKNYIGDGYVETIQRLEYVYGKDKLLKQKNHYFTDKSNPETNESNPTQEKLGSKLVN